MGYAINIVRETARTCYGAGTPVPDAAPVPDADSDFAEDLGDEIALLAAHMHAARHRFLVLIARFDRMLGWEPAGHRTCAHWLAFRTGLDLGTAREHVRVARALEDLPRTNAAMASGALAFSQVRALTRVAKPDTEEDLLALAEGCTTAQLERVVRAWKRGTRKDEAEQERIRHNSRTLSVFPDEEGMYVVTGLLDAEVGALLMRAIEAASDALYRKRKRASAPAYTHAAECEAARRRADSIGLLAERALAAGFDESESSPESSADAPISGTRAKRLQVVLHVEPATLSAEEEPGRSELEDGTRVSAETSRRLSCDAGVVRVTRAPDGSILNVGRKTRTIPPSLRRALEVRDRGCRFPGCNLRFTDAHHVVHWADGGETSLENTILLCRYHHRLVHEEGWTVEWWGKERMAAFRDPRGSVHLDGRRHPPRLPADPVAALSRQNRLHGADPDAYTACARWKRECDIPVEVLSRATEAVL